VTNICRTREKCKVLPTFNEIIKQISKNPKWMIYILLYWYVQFKVVTIGEFKVGEAAASKTLLQF
jgi:hypothetical protein